MSEPASITLSPRLSTLFSACAKVCDPGCCGIDAFSFSPLYIASHLTAYTGAIERQALDELEADLDELLKQSGRLSPNEHGQVCLIEGTNHYFTHEGVEELVRHIRRNLQLAPQVVEYVEELEAIDSATQPTWAMRPTVGASLRRKKK